MHRRERNYDTEIIGIRRGIEAANVTTAGTTDRPSSFFAFLAACLRFHLAAWLEHDLFQLTKHGVRRNCRRTGSALLHPPSTTARPHAGFTPPPHAKHEKDTPNQSGIGLCIMVALWNRADHYIFILLFLLPLSSFSSSPNLSRRRLDVCHAATHGVALVRISDAGLKRAARGSLKIQDAKSRQKSPSGHHRTTLSGYIFATKALIDNRKKGVKQQYVLHMSS